MMTSAYYNEFDAYPAQWLRNLAAAGHITAGTVDGRSIKEVTPDDLQGHTRAHFFAGIGGWDHALKLAGWPDDLPVWTGSCPCQPFSAAGAGRGLDDERHLWPVWFKLIKAARPPFIFGEQVSSPDALSWWDVVSSDLENAGYSCRAIDLCAASVGAPHIRQRLFWTAVRREGARRVGDSDERRVQPIRGRAAAARSGRAPNISSGRGTSGRVAYANDAQRGPDSTRGHIGHGQDAGRAQATGHDPERGDAGRVGNANDERPQGRGRRRNSADQRPSWPSGMVDARGAGSLAGQWAEPDWLYCRDGKRRPVEPGTQPLANGIPGRVGQLRAYGNAIVPQAAAALIRATMAAIASGA